MICKMKTKINRNNYRNIVLYIIIAIQMIILVDFFYFHHFEHSMFESDAASEIVLAESLADNGQWILSDNWYYSTEVRVLYDHLIMVPFYHIFHNYKISFFITNIVLMILLIGAVIYFLRGMDLSYQYCFLGGLLSVIPYGSYRRYSPFSMFLGNGYYSFYLILSLLFLGLYVRLKRNISVNRKWWLRIAFSGVLSLGMGLSGLRYAMILLVPLAVYEAIHFFLEDDSSLWMKNEKVKSNLKRILPFAILIIFFAIGFVALQKIISPIYGGRDYVQSNISRIEDLREQFQFILLGVFQMFGFSMDGGHLLSIMGLMNLVGLGYLLMIIFLLVDSIRSKDGILKNYAAFSLVQGITNILLLMFIKNADIGATVRYVWIGLFCIFFLPAVWMARSINAGNRIKGMVAICCFAVFVSNNANLIMSYNLDNSFVADYSVDVVKSYYRNATPFEREGYISFLKVNNLKCGYATFWNANITTVLTEKDIVVIGINNDSDYSLFEWLTKKEYRDRDATESQFYLLTLDEENTRLSNEWEMFGTEQYRDDKFVIYVR